MCIRDRPSPPPIQQLMQPPKFGTTSRHWYHVLNSVALNNITHQLQMSHAVIYKYHFTLNAYRISVLRIDWLIRERRFFLRLCDVIRDKTNLDASRIIRKYLEGVSGQIESIAQSRRSLNACKTSRSRACYLFPQSSIGSHLNMTNRL